MIELNLYPGEVGCNKYRFSYKIHDKNLWETHKSKAKNTSNHSSNKTHQSADGVSITQSGMGVEELN